MESKVFISYSRKDTEVVKDIVSKIDKALGIQCWIDLKGIESSSEFREVIIKAIDDAEIVLFMLSENSMSSAFAKKEILYSKDTKRVVTICLGDSRPSGWFKFEFAGVDYIRATDESQMNKLIEDLAKWLNIDMNNSSIDGIVYNIKIKPNSDCRVLVDEQELGIAKASILTKFPLSRGEYTFACISMTTGERLDFEDISIINCDILKKPIFGLSLESSNIVTDDITTIAKKSIFSAPRTNSKEFVDLGLSVDWATCNIGADSPEMTGDYFAWGETETKKNKQFTKKEYKLGTPKFLSMKILRYNNDDNLMSLSLSDDAAFCQWGREWRMPTKDEVQELIDNCNFEYIPYKQIDRINRIYVYKCTSKINGNHIIIPCGGKIINGEIDEYNTAASLWSSLRFGLENMAETLHLFYDLSLTMISVDRWNGIPIRPVHEKNNQ